MSKTPAKAKIKAPAKRPAKRAPKPPPIGYSLRVTAPEGLIYRGDIMVITGTSTNLRPKKDTRYSWTSDSGPVYGTSNVGRIDTLGLKPGAYTVIGHVSQGIQPELQADARIGFIISTLPPGPPPAPAPPPPPAPRRPFWKRSIGEWGEWISALVAGILGGS